MNVDATIVQYPASWVTEQRVGDELADSWLCNDTSGRERLSSPKQLQSGKCALLHGSLLTANCVQTGTLANVWTWQGRYSTNIGNSKLGTSDNKVKDPLWTLDDFKDPAHMAAERARHTIAQKRPRTSHDGTTCLGLTFLRLSNFHLSPTQTQPEAMKGPCEASKKRCAHTVNLHDCA